MVDVSNENCIMTDRFKRIQVSTKITFLQDTKFNIKMKNR